MPFRDKYKLKRHVDQCTVEVDGEKLSAGQSIFATLSSLNDAEENRDKSKPSEKHREDNSTVAVLPTAFKCSECDYEGPTYDAIMKHLTRHPGKHPGICRFCGKWFATRYKLWRHMMSSVHDMVSEQAMQQAKADLESLRIGWLVSENRKRGNINNVTCHECTVIFKSRRLLERHMRKQHASRTMCKYRCSMCMRCFMRKRFLNEHIRTVHRVNRLNCESQFRCPVCSRNFSQKGHMYRHHEKMHTPVQQRPFTAAGNAIVDVHESQTKHMTLQSSSTSNQHEEASSEMADSKRVDRPSSFTRRDGVIVALGEKWVEVMPTTCNEQGAEQRVDTWCGNAHSCFVCCKHLDTKQSFLQHVEHHLCWVALPGGPQPANLFETSMPIDPSTCAYALAASNDNNHVVTCEANLPLEGPEDGSDDFANPLEAAKSPVLMGGLHEPGLRLTTINRNALIDMMQGHIEEDATHGLSAPTTPPGVEASEQSEKQKTLEAAAAIVDLSEQAALLGNMSGSIVIPRVEVDDDSGIAHLSETKSGTVDLERGLDVEVVYQCPYCGESAATLDAMYSHKTADHKMQAVFRCVQSSCGKTFDDVDSYHEHSRIHSQLAFICLTCNAHFSDLCELLAHKSSAHRRTIDPQRRRMCSLCHNGFVCKKTANSTTDTTRYDYCATCSNTLAATADESSREQKPKTKEFLCDQCGTTCGSQDALTRHISTHRASRVHRCDLCEVTFHKGEHLRRHLVTKHSDERPFACTFPGCTKSFKRRDKLQDHHKLHSEVRPYVCHICGRAYRYRDGLRYHEKTHRRVSKFRCDTCSQAFVRPGLLKEHMRNLHSDSTKAGAVYACDVCHAKFTRPERMKRHMENEHRVRVEWKLNCTHCNMGFPGTRSLHTHIARQHPDETTQHHERSRSNTIPVPADINSTVDQKSTANNTEQVKQVALTTKEAGSAVATQAHTGAFSDVVDQLLSAQHVMACDGLPTRGQHSEQPRRLEPLPSFEVNTPSQDTTATVVSCESVNTLQSLLTMYVPHSMQVGASIPSPGSTMHAHNVHLQQQEQQMGVPRGFSPTVLHSMTGTQSSRATASMHHANPQAMVESVMVGQGMTNEAPPGMLAVPLQHFSLQGVKTTAAAPAQNIVSSSQTLFASSDQHLQHQPYTQALIADFTKPSPNQTGITTSQQQPLLGLAELPHSQANIDALNTLQHLAWMSSLDKPLVVQPQSTQFSLPLQSQTYSVSASQCLPSFTGLPILNQPSQFLSVLASLNQSLPSQPCIPVTHHLPQVVATMITSTQPSQSQPQTVPGQFGCKGLSELTPAIAPLHGSAELSQLHMSALIRPSQNQPVSQEHVSALKEPSQNQPVYQMSALIRPSQIQSVSPVLMSALSQPVCQVGNLLMPALIQPPQTQPASQVHVSALNLQLQNQPVNQIGKSKFTESLLDQVNMPAWNQPSQSLPQPLSQPVIDQQLNTQRISVVNPRAVPPQSVVKPMLQSCITPLCSPRCATSPMRIALPFHSSMPTALSFTSQPPLKNLLFPSAAVSSNANILGSHGYYGKSVASMMTDRGESHTALDRHQKVSDTLGTGSFTGHFEPTSAVPPIYTTSQFPSNSLLPGTARLAYRVDRGSASVPMSATATYGSDTIRPHAGHNGAALRESSIAASYRLWPPYNVVTATKDGIPGPGDSPRMSPTRPPQIANELEDHMMRLSQVLSILPESLGLQQTLANDSASSQVVSATSTCKMYDDNFTANVSGLITPALGGQICSTLHESATSLRNVDTSNIDRMAPSQVTGSIDLQPASRPPGHVETPISAIECAAMPSSLVGDSLSIPNLLSGNPPIAPTQTGQKNVIGHMVSPNVDKLSHEILFQNVPSFETYTTYQGHY